jgi:hypothetical protein
MVSTLAVAIDAVMTGGPGMMWGGRHCAGARFGARIVGACGECVRARRLGGAAAGASVRSC